MAYPTLAQLKTHLGVSGSTQDTKLTFALNAAVGIVERYCGRSFITASATKNFRVVTPYVVGAELLLFRDLATITTVTNGDGVVVASGDRYTLPEDAPYYGIVLREGSGLVWSDGGNGGRVAIAGTWGMDTPDDIFWAVLELAKFEFQASLQGAGGEAVSTGFGTGVSVLAAGLPVAVAVVLDRRRRRQA